MSEQQSQKVAAPKSVLAVSAVLLIMLIASMFVLRSNDLNISFKTRPSISTSEMVGLNLQLTQSTNPQERAKSAQRLSEIAVQQLDTKVTSNVGDSPKVIEERLKHAVANEVDPQARASIAAALAKIQNRQMVESSLNPLTQRFK
ncbi:MAG: hypothetical protein WC714_14240 [Candidatus Obscuribacterales bacterium]|jgi:hypothetical protein